MLTTKNTIGMSEKKVQPKDDVTVYGTGTSKHLPKGTKITVHKEAAETLIRQGRATYEEVAPDADTKKKKV